MSTRGRRGANQEEEKYHLTSEFRMIVMSDICQFLITKYTDKKQSKMPLNRGSLPILAVKTSTL